MTKRSTAVLILLGLIIAMFSAGCSSTPASPTAKPTETASTVYLVVTATVQPTIEATTVLEPTITPLATFTPIGLNSPTPAQPSTVTPTVRKATVANPPAGKTPAASTPKPANTPKPAATNPPPTPVPAQYGYPAPEVVGPPAGTLINDGNAIQLQFRSVGHLPPDVCYEVFVKFTNPNAPAQPSNTLWSFGCGDQNEAGTKLTMPVTKFRGDPYNYITMRDESDRLAQADYLTVTWTVTIGKRDGTLLGPISQGTTLKFQAR